jgi:hypothetical protein
MKFLPYCLLASCHLISPVAHAEINWSFTVETPIFVVKPTDSFSVLGRMTNLASSTSVLSIHEPCPLCVIPATIFVGASDSTPFDVYAVDTSTINDVLPGLRLNPGESFSFTAYTVSPIASAVPLGNYEFVINDLFIPGHGFRNGGPVHIAVVPEPSASMLMLAGLGILGIALRSRKAYV